VERKKSEVNKTYLLTNNDSYYAASWKRLKRNIPAMAGLITIVIVTLVGIFAYFLAPDNTPNADRQMLEVQSQSPGFNKTFLLVKNNREVDTGLLQTLLFGKESSYSMIPINRYTIKGDSVVADKYIDEDVSERVAYRNNQLVSAGSVMHQTFWLGTDRFGRDILSRLIVGIRVSLAVGLISLIISLLLGITLGSMAGYYGGKTDSAIMWLINVIWSIPTLLLVFGITVGIGKGFLQIFIAIGLTLWTNVARLVRGQVMAIKRLEYVDAATALGYSNNRIIFRHILPNIVGPVMVISASNFATAIIIEAGLSFLGIGVQPPTPSWGGMIKEQYNFIITHHASLAIAPGLAIMLLVLAFNLLGNGLRDAFDVR
jgi:ABC-type dipeptide/oligopeptide/nickel transport system permease subunit